MSQKIAIIGSGFLGLTLALRLAEEGNQVTIFESANEIGGLASVWQLGDLIWDRHYHVTLFSDAFTRKIVGELGLADQFEWVETKTGFYTDGKLVSMSNTLEFLKFPPLDLISKLRLGGTIFYSSRVKNWKKLEKITVEEWLTKLSGKRTFEKMWKPLLKAKLGAAYQETSAAFIWATIQRMYAARNSGLKKEMFGYVRGGYATVLKHFAETLQEKGVTLRLNSNIEEIQNHIGKIAIKIENAPTTIYENAKLQATESSCDKTEKIAKEERLDDFDKAILTCSSGIAAKICPQLRAEEKEKLKNIKYQGIVCGSLLTKKSLSPFYVTNITDESPFTGIIEMSSLVDKGEFGGNALIYLPKYVSADDKLFDRSDTQIEEEFLSELERMFSHFDRSDVIEFKVSRVKKVFPIPTLSYSENVPPAETSIKNVYIVNSSQITNGTLNVNETIQLAEKFFKNHFES